MRVYPAIVPPPEIANRISAFSNALADPARGITAQRASGPHITLKAPQYPDHFEDWLQAATAAAGQIHAFEVSFGAPTFVGRHVLAITAAAPELLNLNARLATALGRYNHPSITSYDYDLYTPHITLAYCQSLPHGQRVQLHDRVLSELLPLPGFTATSVAVFTRNDSDFQYRLSHQLPLT